MPTRYLVFVCLVVCFFCIPAFAQNKTSQADKDRSEHFKSMAAVRAEEEQRKVIVNDLINTYSKCREYADQFNDAEKDSPKEKFYSNQTDQCYSTLWAKIDKTPLQVLTPFSTVTKGTDLQQVKHAAFFRLYEAYEYGIQQAKLTKP